MEDFEVRVNVSTFSVKDIIDVWVWLVWHSLENADHPGLKNVGCWLDSHWKDTAFEESDNCEDLLCFVGERDGQITHIEIND